MPCFLRTDILQTSLSKTVSQSHLASLAYTIFLLCLLLPSRGTIRTLPLLLSFSYVSSYRINSIQPILPTSLAKNLGSFGGSRLPSAQYVVNVLTQQSPSIPPPTCLFSVSPSIFSPSPQRGSAHLPPTGFAATLSSRALENTTTSTHALRSSISPTLSKSLPSRYVIQQFCSDIFNPALKRKRDPGTFRSESAQSRRCTR